MAEQLGIYKCGKCGNIVQVLHSEKPPVVCCGQNMDRLVENTIDAALEKHVPVVEKIDGGYLVKVGSVAHPMGNDHFIEWIELVSCDGNYVQRMMLSPTSKPEATFKTDSDKVVAKAYCNLHGLWQS
ncbi:MAG: desulfoferrodoxin [Desulfobacula sp.]|jgi:superoxide reductase|uniref:desulfoferrodoxin n=1 Tax=Desulfobacula sp. TaxID=2593537 RepID=UPI001D9AE22F|nr:desulfoferrodoxin [Desulfobacula sp.]MBT3484732.1 desulfoferrodoxin [Desulfobacula sp.]MBT3804362.1 desulfoferrodoxin [Desulfobacula sp.]MBT4025153.1 desulfoferrodoxin [Desulfobacula sp.]MBT4198555.1 desulfoferrodoxin [Desulfobacula sp.]